MSMSNKGNSAHSRNPCNIHASEYRQELEPYVRHPYAYAQYPSEDEEAAPEIGKKTWRIRLYCPATGTRIAVEWPIRRLAF